MPRQRRPTPQMDDTRNWSPFDVAYLAGIIDGEGCLSILRTARRRNDHGHANPHFGTRLAVTNASYELLYWCDTTFGPGTLTHKTFSNENWKPCYQWIMGSVGAYLILKATLPSMRVKFRQAELVMEFTELMAAKTYRNESVTPELLAEKERLRAELLVLNGRQKAGISKPPSENLSPL